MHDLIALFDDAIAAGVRPLQRHGSNQFDAGPRDYVCSGTALYLIRRLLRDRPDIWYRLPRYRSLEECAQREGILRERDRRKPPS